MRSFEGCEVTWWFTYEFSLCNFASFAVIFVVLIFKWIFVHGFLKLDIILCDLSNSFLEARFVKPSGQSGPYRWFKFLFFFKKRWIFHGIFRNLIFVIITRPTQVGDYRGSISAELNSLRWRLKLNFKCVNLSLESGIFGKNSHE